MTFNLTSAFKNRILFNISARQTKTDTYAKSVNPIETVRKEPSHQYLHCLSFFMLHLNHNFQQRPNSKIEESTSETQD